MLIEYFSLTCGIQILFRIKHHNLNELMKTDCPRFISMIVSLTMLYLFVLYNNSMYFKNRRINLNFNFLGNISYPLYLTHQTKSTCLKSVSC